MTETETRSILMDEGTFSPEFLRLESEPWISFYRAGETIREMRKGLAYQASTGAEAHRWDEEAASRMNDEGCPNQYTTTLPAATGPSRIGGRLHLVGSPIF